MPISLLQLIETRLADHSPQRKRLRALRKRAAVAMVLQVREGELHILMIKRAERDGDPWSGHMAFPGGRMEASDASGFEAARRELNARPSRGSLGMIVTPFVFRMDREVEFTPNYEVAEVVWVPLEFLLDLDNRQQMTWSFKGVDIPMPCYFYGKRRIWGMSLMMLDELLDLVEGSNKLRSSWRR